MDARQGGNMKLIDTLRIRIDELDKAKWMIEERKNINYFKAREKDLRQQLKAEDDRLEGENGHKNNN